MDGAFRVRARRIALGALVSAAVVVAYAPALHAPLLYDDVESIEGNPSIRRLWPPTIAFSPPPNLAVSGRPIANYSLAVSFALNRLIERRELARPGEPAPTLGYHLVNLVLHLLCGALLFGLTRRTLAAQRYDDTARTHADLLAAGISMVWLLHPMQTEAVNYVVQRTEILVSLFLLATLFAWARAWQSGSHRTHWRVAAVAACLAGMGSKEVMAVAPFLVLLYDRAFWRPSWRAVLAPDTTGARDDRRLFYAGLFATLGWLVALILQNPRAGTVGFATGMPWYRYLSTQAWAIGHYIRLSLWPAGFTIDYGQHAIAGRRAFPGAVLLAAMAGGVVMAWRRSARWGWAGFIGTAFFLILAPSSSVVPIATEVAAERRFYLPLAALVSATILGIAALIRRRGHASDEPSARGRLTRPLGAIVAALSLLLTTLTFRRSAEYKDPDRLYREAIARAPDNVRAYGNLAALVQRDSARRPEARRLFERAIALDSAYGFAWEGLVEMDIADGRFDEAKPLLEGILARAPANPRLQQLYGVVLGALGDPDASLPFLERAAAASGAGAASAYADLGRGYAAAGRLDDAIRSLTRSLELDPEGVATRAYLGFVLIAAGRASDAVEQLEGAVRADSNVAVHRAWLALAYAETGRLADARTSARVAIERAGSEARVYSAAGLALAQAGFPLEARAALRRAVALNPRDQDAAAVLRELGGAPN